MTRTVDEAEAKLDGFDATLAKAVTASRTTVQAMAPATRLGWLGRALEELDLPTGCLDPARALADTERDLGRRQVEREMEARRRRQQALAGLVDDPAGSLEAATAAYAAEAAWLDVPAGQQWPPAVGLARNARRTIESRIDGALMGGAGPEVFDMVQGKAAEVVTEVAELPRVPTGVWSVSNAAEELSKYRAHRSSWGTLLAAWQIFGLCHQVADLFRDYLGYSSSSLNGPPGWALAWRNWRPVLDDPQWPTVRKELRLPYAIEHGYQPGVWRPDEVESKPEDRTFRGRLRNLGSAVG